MRSAQAVGLFYASVSLAGCAQAHSTNRSVRLVPDPAKRLDLPEGFSYTLISETGGTMSDGFFRPGRPDGMACFADPDDADKCILMRNHENWNSVPTGSPFGKGNELLDRVSDSQLYDRKADGSPFFGGVTKLVYDLKHKRMERDFLVLTGTAANCAGGPTPWGSWLSCEEEMLKPEEGPGKYHGFVFETPSRAVLPLHSERTGQAAAGRSPAGAGSDQQKIRDHFQLAGRLERQWRGPVQGRGRSSRRMD